jgi:hypothetical protein
MSATCKDCKKEIVWAASNGRTLPFERTVFGTGAVAISKHFGTYRARPHRGSPHVQAYKRHQCRRRKA